MTMHWSVAQIFSKRGLAIQEEISRNGFATFLPMMRSKRYVDGQESNTARPAMPGYLFIWNAPGNFYTPDGRSMTRIIGRMSDEDLSRIRSDNAAGKHDKIAAGPSLEGQTERKKQRRRRPRPSKRARMAMRAK